MSIKLNAQLGEKKRVKEREMNNTKVFLMVIFNKVNAHKKVIFGFSEHSN